MILYQLLAERMTDEEYRISTAQDAYWTRQQSDATTSSRTDYTHIKQFQVPPALESWMQSPHETKLFVSTNGDINISGTRAPVGKLAFEFDEHHQFSNFYNQMNLQLPTFIFDQSTQTLRFDTHNLITWNSIEALFQWFKLWISDQPNTDQKAWSRLTPDQAKQKARSFKADYKTYEHRLFRFVCAVIAAKFYSDPRLMKMLLDTEDKFLLEIVSHWKDEVWGGKKEESSYHKLGWILMNLRETIRKEPDLSRLLTAGAPRDAIWNLIPRVYNSDWLFRGLDMGGEDYPFSNAQNRKEFWPIFGFALK